MVTKRNKFNPEREGQLLYNYIEFQKIVFWKDVFFFHALPTSNLMIHICHRFSGFRIRLLYSLCFYSVFNLGSCFYFCVSVNLRRHAFLISTHRRRSYIESCGISRLRMLHVLWRLLEEIVIEKMLKNNIWINKMSC